MPRKRKARKLGLIIEGTGLSYPLGQVIALDDPRPLLHFDERAGGSVDIRYSAGLISDLEVFTGFTIHRRESLALWHSEVELTDQGDLLQLARVSALPLAHFYLHLNRLANGRWRMAYGDGKLPDIELLTGISLIK